MSLIKCHECGSDVSTEANACPNCGARVKKGMGCGSILLIFFGVIVFIAIIKCSSPSALSSQANPVHTTDANSESSTKKTVRGYLASPSLELLEKATSFIVAKDDAALQKLMETGLVIHLKGDLEVEVVDIKFFKGVVKIRPRGETLELWTNIEAIK